MELKEFIGKVVVKAGSKRRFYLREITAPCIGITSVDPEPNGYPVSYSYRTINGDPFSKGTLLFEEPDLLEPFKEAYNLYCRTEDARWENYHYWLSVET